jgi:pimeloyl-ACP methyl ester carboxylesterase
VTGGALLLVLGVTLVATQLSAGSPGSGRTYHAGAAIVTVYEESHSRGVMVTSGGWAYCNQVRALARKKELTLLCGRYPKDGYVGPALRSRRHLDWGEKNYLSSLAHEARALHDRLGGELLLVGVSYSGFGVAALASQHPELRPDRLIVIDSYLDLVARREAAGSGAIGREIDIETGGTDAALMARNVRVDRLARLVAAGTRLQVIWSIAPDEAREFKGATCNRAANAAVLQQLADTLGRPVAGWVTENRHGHDLWDHGRRIMRGDLPGRKVFFRPGGAAPAAAVCS